MNAARDLRLDVVSDLSAFESLAGEWDALLARSATDSVFLRHAWLRTWWAVFGSGFDVRVVIVRRDDGTLVGAAPWIRGRGPGRLVGRLSHLMLMGQQGETLAEHLDLLADAAYASNVVPALVEQALGERAWHVCLLERVPEASPHLPWIRDTFEAAGLEVETAVASESPYLPLPSSFEELLAGASRNFRRQWRNSANRLQREGTVRMLLAGRDLPLDEAFDHLVRLHRARWGDGGSFRTPAYVAFHQALSRAFLDEDALHLALLEVGGTVVAARYDFLHAQKVWCFQGGRDPGMERMRPGTVLTGRVLEWAIENGYREYDFLSGGEGYKSRWATASRSLVDVRAWRDVRRVRLTRRLQGWKDRWRARARAQAAQGSP